MYNRDAQQETETDKNKIEYLISVEKIKQEQQEKNHENRNTAC